ncbi:hypothetical protein P692DRAFT_20710282, partial [Suillus brevipes Sb2]
LESTGPVNLFRFIINPLHFSQSVENLYYLSFLFCNGLCGFHMSDTNESILCEQRFVPLLNTLMQTSSTSAV